GEAQGLLYYVMPYVVGESLRRRLSRQVHLPIDEAVEIACEVANALGYAHAQGIVHRDIKPENILLTEGHAVVADFGIARAISAAVTTEHDSVTGTGLVLGTPLYMSPEQVGGDFHLDGRSDLYSLGCVMYEMLVGEPPFRGPTPQSVTTQHVMESVPPIRIRRPEVPAKLEQVVLKALQKIPADRFASAAEFEAALPSHRTPPEPQIPTVPTRVQRRHRVHVSRAGWALIGALALASALTATAFHRRSTPVMDQSLYMVLPFRHRAESAPRLLNGDQCESLLHDALARWRGLQLVDPLWVADARSRRGGSSSVEAGLSIARERRAGRVVLGEVWQFKDTIYVRGLLYDAGGQKLVREQSVRIAPDLRDAQERFEELADSLLIGGGVATGAPPRSGDRLSLPAWRAFQDAYLAMQRWDLDSAKARLQRALAIDPSYGMAQLSLAQVLTWSGEDAKSWRGYAAGALSSGDSLPARERALAAAMLALADQHFPEACEKFRALIARDSLDFAAWFGLGECQGKDPLVVRDAGSPSGWKFRGSYEAAVTAYRHALEIVPSVHLAFRDEGFSRLPRLLYTETNYIRQGYALAPDTVRLGAFPSMPRDTLEFVPWPIKAVLAAEPQAMPATLTTAVERNRELLRDIAVSWVRAFPRRAEAHETLALVLETLGELTAGRSQEYSALSEIRRARMSTAKPAVSLRLANIETRFLLKSGQMAQARALADSLLRANPRPDMDDARQLRGLAALTGHVHLTAQLQRKAAPDFTFLTPDWEEVNVPLPLTDAALGLFAYSAFGNPMDSLAALEQRVERLIPSYVESSRRLRTRQALLDVPAVLAFPERGIRPMHRAQAGGNYRLVMQWKLARRDTAGVREEFRSLRAARRGLRPGDVAFDGTYHEARLLLALGDTAEAIRLLDLSLNALPT
ncbi:MAG TPA: protein kinase, partial [Gemmatimonadales bacterium]